MQRSLDTQPDGIPRPALMLGIAGLLPFVAIPLGVGAERWLPGVIPASLGPHFTIPALSLYAATILSFMGGVQWGLAVATPRIRRNDHWRRYGVAVLPAIGAWASLMLTTRAALVAMAAGFVLLLIYDIWTVRQGEAPQWYERLRLGLTSVVVVMLTLTVTLLT